MNTSSSSDDKSCCSQYDCLFFISCSPESPSLPAPRKLNDLVQKRTDLSRLTYHVQLLFGNADVTYKINFCRVKVKFSGLYVITYLEVRSTLTRKYKDLPRVTLPIFSKFSPSALMLMILKMNQYSSEVLFIT